MFESAVKKQCSLLELVIGLRLKEYSKDVTFNIECSLNEHTKRFSLYSLVQVKYLKKYLSQALGSLVRAFSGLLQPQYAG